MLHNLLNLVDAFALVLLWWALPAALIVLTYALGHAARKGKRYTTTRDRAAARKRHPSYRGVTRVETYREV